MTVAVRVDEPEPGYSTREVMAAADVSYRQLDHWDRTGVLCPSARPARGSGTQRRYSAIDAIAAGLLGEAASVAGMTPTGAVDAVLADTGLAIVVVGHPRPRFQALDERGLAGLLESGPALVISLAAVRARVSARLLNRRLLSPV